MSGVFAWYRYVDFVMVLNSQKNNFAWLLGMAAYSGGRVNNTSDIVLYLGRFIAYWVF